jgi:hypothetical protein
LTSADLVAKCDKVNGDTLSPLILGEAEATSSTGKFGGDTLSPPNTGGAKSPSAEPVTKRVKLQNATLQDTATDLGKAHGGQSGNKNAVKNEGCKVIPSFPTAKALAAQYGVHRSTIIRDGKRAEAIERQEKRIQN